MQGEDALPRMTPRQATDFLRAKVESDLELRWTRHAAKRMKERHLIVGDILHILKFGYVFEEGEPASSPGVFKYKMECRTPNSGARTVVIVVIPSAASWVKLVTVMWKDEPGGEGTA
jgi:hypothetical protein